MIFREALLTSVLAALGEPGATVRLVGVPGSGVSTLATAITARFRGARFALGGPTVVERLEAALGGAPAARLARIGPCLLVLDHGEAQPAPDLRDHVEGWRASAPDLRVVIACRRTPRLLAERTFELTPLGDDLAVGFFATTSGGQVPAALIERLAGLPLAWELAARQLTALTPDALIDRLDQDPFQALRDPSAAGSPSLYHTFSRWWLDLRPEDRAHLTALSPLAGTFLRRTAAVALAIDDEAAIDALQALRVRRVVSVTSGSPLRFRLDPWVRRWARRADPAQFEAARSRLLAGTTEEIGRLGPEPHRAATRALQEWRAERENLVGYLLEGSDDERAVALARFAAEVEMLHPQPGSFDLARRLHRRILEIQTGDPYDRQRITLAVCTQAIADGSFDVARRAIQTLPPGPTGSCRAPPLLMLGDALLLNGRFAEAAEVFEEGAIDADTCGADSDAAMSYQQLAVAHVRLGRTAEALAATEKAVARIDRCAPSYRAKVLQNASFVYAMLDRLAEAEACTRGALAVFESTNSHRHAGISKLQLGALAARRGDEGAARGWLARAASDLEGTGDQRLLLYVRAELATLLIRTQPVEAADVLEACASSLEDAGFMDYVHQFRALAALALVLASRLDPARALVDRVRASPPRGNGAEQGLAIAHLVDQAVALASAPDAGDRSPELDRWLSAIPERGRHRVLDQAYDALVGYVRQGRGATWVSADGHHLRGPGGERAKVHGANARILCALYENAPTGAALGVRELAVAGWPDETLDVEAAGLRVRVALTTLRKAGLRDVLQRSGHGWRLNPNLPVRLLPPDPDSPADAPKA